MLLESDQRCDARCIPFWHASARAASSTNLNTRLSALKEISNVKLCSKTNVDLHFLVNRVFPYTTLFFSMRSANLYLLVIFQFFHRIIS